VEAWSSLGVGRREGYGWDDSACGWIWGGSYVDGEGVEAVGSGLVFENVTVSSTIRGVLVTVGGMVTMAVDSDGFQVERRGHV
jgi:hypothetical protein